MMPLNTQLKIKKCLTEYLRTLFSFMLTCTVYICTTKVFCPITKRHINVFLDMIYLRRHLASSVLYLQEKQKHGNNVKSEYII